MSRAIAIAPKAAAAQQATVRILVGGDSLTIEHIMLNRDDLYSHYQYYIIIKGSEQLTKDLW